LTDEEEGPDIVIGTHEIQEVTGTLEIHYRSTKAHGNKSNSGTSSSVSVKVTKVGPVQNHLTSGKSDLTKTHPDNTKLSVKGSQT
jgi:hypothetical protein